MAGNTTKPYRNTFSGSVGAGMGSLFNPGGRRYYILEHKVSSKYHRAGESQEIIVDNIELGRDPHCQVRFDESFKTVSRHHAAIVKDGDNWKLVQISKTNTTLLNGRPVRSEWYLQNGDEIQLAVNGPKLGFIVPSGNKATVGSIGLSRRLSLFRQQALRPYKYAITVLACVLLLCVGAGGFVISNQHAKNKELYAYAEHLKEMSSMLEKKLEEERRKGDQLAEEVDSLKKLPPKKEIIRIREIQPGPDGDNSIERILDNYKQDVYFLSGKVFYLIDGEITPAYLLVRDRAGNTVDKNGKPTEDPKQIAKMEWGWTGTAFLLNDGKLVTARHCIQGWRFPNGPHFLDIIEAQHRASKRGGELVAQFIAVSKNGNKISFTSKECRYNDKNDVPYSHTFEDGETWNWRQNNLDSNNSDWSYYQTNLRGNFEADYASSTRLAAGTVLHILGFPIGLGVNDIDDISPLYTKVNTAIDGCNKAGNIIHTGGTEHGNSGGPIAICKDGKLYVVGIVSGMATKNGQLTEKYDIATPIAQINK